MQTTDRMQIMAAYSMLASFYQTEIRDDVLAVYADHLADLPKDQVLAALSAMRLEPGRRTVPLPQDVRGRVGGGETIEDQANTLAGRVVDAIGKFGYMRPSEARAWLGEAGWQVVIAKGGWRTLCSTTIASDNAFFAQCRDLARGALRRDWQVEDKGKQLGERAQRTLSGIQKEVRYVDAGATGAAGREDNE